MVLMIWCHSNLVLANETSIQQPQLILALTHIDGVMDVNDGNAPYNRFMTALTEDFNLQFDAQFYPSGRSNFLMDTGKVDCIFPIVMGVFRRNVETIYVEPVNRVSVHLFTHGDNTFSSMEQLHRKTVVYPQGYLFGNLLKENPFETSFVPVVSQHSGIELLKKGRADAYLDYLPDLRFSLSQEDWKELNYEPEHPIQSTFDGFECRAESGKDRLIEQLNNAISALKQSGKLKLILGDYYNL